MSPDTPHEQSRLIAGRYRLRSVLGSGSMGTVWAAYDETLHRPVAVKEMRLPHGVGAGQVEELRERTLREARAIATLSHPNVITLHDIAKENGEPFVVMELLPSRSLTELVREHGPLSVEQAAAVGDAMAAALAAAHRAGITHRDVKPGNVLISSDGRIKLTDFGISHNVAEATMTHTGIMLGSPAYIAPEIASGQAVTPAADLWGLGATLFAATEGRPPYDVDGDPMETVNQVVRGALPIPSPGPLAPVISGLMVKDPTGRLSLNEVRNQLHSFHTIASHRLFEPELFRSSAISETDAEEVKLSGRAPVNRTLTTEAPSDIAQNQDAPLSELAADPGPLPFLISPEQVPSEQQKPGRSRAATLGILLVSILLFLVAVVGGFVATRALGGQSVTPPAQEGQAPQLAPLPEQLETGTADATNIKGARGGLFTIQIPRGWLRFTIQEPAGILPAGTTVKFVSPDGSQVLSVQRYAGFFPGHQNSDYLKAVESAWPAGDFVRATPVTKLPNRQDGISFTYRTIEQTTVAPKDRSAASAIGRTTFLQVFREDNDLWVVSATVPTEQEELGQTKLFDRVAPTFTTVD